MAVGAIATAGVESGPAARRPQLGPRLPTIAAGVTLAMLLAMTIGTAIGLRDLLNAQSQDRFRQFASNATAEFGAEVNRTRTELASVEGLVRADPAISQVRFQIFASTLERQDTAAQAIGYAPRIAPDQVESFNLLMRSRGYDRYSLQESGTRTEYFPLAHLFPPTPGAIRVGAELSGNDEFLGVLRAARRSGRLTASAPQALATSPQSQASFLMFSPVFGIPDPAPGAADPGLQGYAVGVYRVADFVAGPSARSDLDRISFRIVDRTIGSQATEIFPAPGGDSTAVWPGGMRVARQLDFAGRRWEFEYLSPPEFGLSGLERSAWLIFLGAGLGMTAFATASTYSLMASRQAARSDLQLMTSQIRVILDSAIESILVVDRNKRIVWANQSFADVFGYGDSEQLLGADWLEMRQRPGVRLADRDRHMSRLAEIGDSETFAVTSEDVKILAPVERTLSMTSAPVTDEIGKFVGRLWVYRDVTIERAADQARSEFVSMVSHELRTPLTSLTGFIDLVLDGAGGPVTPETARLLKIAQNNGGRLGRLVADLLDISRLESGRLELRSEAVSMIMLFEELATSMEHEFRSRGISLSLELEDDLPDVWADRERTVQIFTNLLSNAYRYTGEEGSVTVSGLLRADEVEITVRDTGVGIARENQARVFDRFVRLYRGGKRPPGSTGLGLAITKSLVEAHGGSIRLESEEGRGAAFTVILPVALAERLTNSA